MVDKGVTVKSSDVPKRPSPPYLRGEAHGVGDKGSALLLPSVAVKQSFALH